MKNEKRQFRIKNLVIEGHFRNFSFFNFNFSFERKRNGQAILTTIIFLLFVSTAVLFGFSTIVLSEKRLAFGEESSIKSYVLAEAGVEDVVYRMMSAKQYDLSEVLALDGATTTTSVVTVGNGREVISRSLAASRVRASKVFLRAGGGASFLYGVQVGDQGVVFNNNSGIQGSIYSNGNLDGDSGALITGDAIVAKAPTSSPASFIEDLEIDGDVWVHTLRDSTVGRNATTVTASDITVSGNIVSDTLSECTITGNASYNSIDDCTVSGSSVTPVSVPMEAPPLDFPISDAQIQAWRDEATAGGTISSGDYNPPNNQTTVIGPGVIGGNLILDNKETLVLAGTVWVKKNVDADNGATINLAPSFGDLSVPLLADGWIHTKNNGQFSGSGTAGSYLLFVGLASCLGGAQTSSCTHHNAAIDLHNNATGAIFFAPNGITNLHNNITVTEITARGIRLDNNSVVVYEQGLANLKFSAGPSGSWRLDGWQEVK
ncbi:MAG: hypothetical protein HYW90_00835 [Candidatus Sungbacteria bacterium]|nr:hypothetical protein [Candidatus Sungbacteria bacterium]